LDGIQDLLREHLFERAPIAIAVMDPDHRIVLANQAFESLFGPAGGRHCFEVMKGRHDLCERCTMDWTFADGKVRVCDDRLMVEGGISSHFVIRVAPLASEGEGQNYCLWVASNVNEANSLRRENELLFEKTPCYVTVLDRDLRIVRANRRMREAFGKAWGHPCYTVYKRRHKPCRECPALKVFEDGQDHTSTQVGILSNGEEAHYVVTASALSREGGGPDGRVNFVIEMATDITHLRLLEREKLEAERLAAVGQTVAGLAHGIKNILMGMEGGIYVMQSGLEKGEAKKIDRGMQMLGRNVERISTLAKNLLSFSKGTVPKVALEDPNRVAREVVDLYSDMAAAAGVRLEAELQEGLAPAALDREGIHTCLANLVSNAIDACCAGETAGCRVVVRSGEVRGVLRYEVSDNGCGMDYNVKSRIFTTFFTTKGTGGTGLGLLTTRKIVQEHGGRIDVETAQGKGTTFRILLPRKRLPAPTAAGDDEEPNGNGGGEPAKEGGDAKDVG
jgi:signal transduction histidine kinase